MSDQESDEYLANCDADDDAAYLDQLESEAAAEEANEEAHREHCETEYRAQVIRQASTSDLVNELSKRSPKVFEIPRYFSADIVVELFHKVHTPVRGPCHIIVIFDEGVTA